MRLSSHTAFHRACARLVPITPPSITEGIDAANTAFPYSLARLSASSGYAPWTLKNTEHVSLFRHIYPFIPPLGACSGPGRFRQTSSEGTFLSSIRTYPYRPIRISTGSNSGAFTSQVRQPLGILTMGGLWTPDISSTTENGLSGMFPCLRSTSADFNELHTLPCMS